MRLNLNGQVVLVTGASRGIGRAVAEAMAAAGAGVGLHCSRERREVVELARSLGNGAGVFAADLSRPEAPAKL
ncbi:MAG TPA: SDR family NAD(P)-dependent oxidoreductase, partial [Candidatus Aminicenantes bacterium]|nr:SDR family NAD(P)-dependent oxidoreductase [Candidatus Aminicenantes bacterium]